MTTFTIKRQHKGYYTTSNGYVIVSQELVNNASGAIIDDIKDFIVEDGMHSAWYGYRINDGYTVGYNTKRDVLGFIEYCEDGE